MVYFGTGKYLEEPDNHTTSVQSFYGVWDPDQCTTGGGTVDCGDASLKKRGKNHVLPSGINRGNLLQQSITLQGGGGAAGGSEYRETSDHAIQWRDGGSGHYGWYMDLVYGNDRQGERVVGRAALRGNLVVFASLVPTSDPCSTGAFGWLMALDRSNGGRPETQPFDINGDGEIGENDFSSNNNVTSGAKSEGVLSNPQILADVSNDKMAISSDGETKMVTLENGFKRGRHRWQQMQ
jgi:type IV pilus assembly protein PilY1